MRLALLEESEREIINIRASRLVDGNLNFYRRQFSISHSRRSFTFVVVLARLYRSRLIRRTTKRAFYPSVPRNRTC